MSEEKFEENSTSQDYAAPQDYSAPDMSYSNAGSQAETPVTPVTENGPQTESWQNQGGWQQPQQPEFQNQGSFQNQGNFQSQGNYQGQPDFTGQGSAQNYNTAPGAGSNGWQQQYTNPQAQQQKQEPGKGFAIASMILGIVSLGTFLYLHQCPACNRSDHTCNRAVCEKRQERHGDRGNDHRNRIHRTVHCFLGADFRQCDR